MFAIKTILSVTLLLITSTAFAAGPFVKGELLVQLTTKADKGNVHKAIKANDGEILEDIPQLRVKRIKIPVKNLNKVKEALANNPNFEFVEENFIAQGMLVPDDPHFASQWHHTKIMSRMAWDMGTGSAEMPIAIVDSGVDPDHPDLMAKLQPGYNFLGNNTDTHDVLGHGTAVAGSAGALSNNAMGVAGVAWKNPIMPLVVLNSSNWATYSDISRAIIYAVDHGVKVINISIGGTSFSSTLDNAVNYAWNNGALVFACAANYNTSTRYYPAACSNAVAVAATDYNDNKASFSNYGDWITLSAPGVSIKTTNNGGGYGSWNGTSFASPITAATAALVWGANPQLTHVEVLEILKISADDLGGVGFDNTFGYGRINANNAMMEAMNHQPTLDTEPPSVVLTSPGNNQTVSGLVTISANANDNVVVAKVDFRLDGELLASDSTAPYTTTWDASSAGSGFYTVEALAFDTSGNASLADTVEVFIEQPVVEEPVNEEPIGDVVDNLPPIVSILSPTSGTTLNKKGQFVHVLASDESGVVEMKVFVDGKLESTQTSNEIKWRWNTRKASKGDHTLRVEARDPAGNVGFDEILVYK